MVSVHSCLVWEGTKGVGLPRVTGLNDRETPQQFVQIGPGFPAVDLCYLDEAVDPAGGFSTGLVAVEHPVFSTEYKRANGVLGAVVVRCQIRMSEECDITISIYERSEVGIANMYS